MSATEDVRMLEAILCALILRAGGTIRLPAREVADAGNGYEFGVRADRKGRAVVLWAEGPEGESRLGEREE
jgi:hypothetical protein